MQLQDVCDIFEKIHILWAFEQQMQKVPFGTSMDDLMLYIKLKHISQQIKLWKIITCRISYCIAYLDLMKEHFVTRRLMKKIEAFLESSSVSEW